MPKVITGAAISLDGFVAGPQESGFDYLFDWYNHLRYQRGDYRR